MPLASGPLAESEASVAGASPGSAASASSAGSVSRTGRVWTLTPASSCSMASSRPPVAIRTSSPPGCWQNEANAARNDRVSTCWGRWSGEAMPDGSSGAVASRGAGSAGGASAAPLRGVCESSKVT